MSSVKNNKTVEKKNAQNLRPYTTSPQSPRKVYEPTAFEGSHINDVYQENEQLKIKVPTILYSYLMSHVYCLFHHILHEFHENCHSILFHEKKTPKDAVTV